MLVDGKAIASDIYREIKNTVSHLERPPHLTVFTCEPNFETQKYLTLKRKKAFEAGIVVNVIEFPVSVTTEEVVQSIHQACSSTDGIIVQLPFPSHIDRDSVLSAIPRELDVDVMNYTGGSQLVLPPVVGAIKEIADRENVSWQDKQVVVVGQGLLVGRPAAIWAGEAGAKVSVVAKDTVNREELIKEADIIISGAGQPGLLMPDMIKPGVMIFDAGTSEEGGVLKGDVDPECTNKAGLFTPVPGGIGPVTVAVLLRNLLYLPNVQ